MRTTLNDQVVDPCLGVAFAPGELVSHELGAAEDGAIFVTVTTSAGDIQKFWVRDPHVEPAQGVPEMREYLLGQLEDWLPESRLRWGQQVRLRPPSDRP